MKQWQVFKHLDTCTGPPDPASSSRPNGQPSSSSGTTSSLMRSSTRQPPLTKRPERLPALNYSILKDQALRKKMAELGLSTTGSRQLLERRHKEWITLWNANCDSSRPKRRAELLHDLDVWERTQGGRAPVFAGSLAVSRPAAVKDKDFDAAAWASAHDASFRDLIANARRSRAAVQAKQGEQEEKSNESEKEEGEEGAGEKGVTATVVDAGEAGQSGEREEALPRSPEIGAAESLSPLTPAPPSPPQAPPALSEQPPSATGSRTPREETGANTLPGRDMDTTA